MTRNNLASCYKAAGRTADAIKLYEATLKLREAKLGPEHPHTLNSRNNLAGAYLVDGRTDVAIKLHESTLKVREATLGRGHPHTLSNRGNLAAAFIAAGRNHRGGGTLRRTAVPDAGIELVGSGTSPKGSSYRSGLADTYLAAGRTNDAIKLHEETLKGARVEAGARLTQ